MAKGVNQIINNIRLRKLRKILNQINALSEEFSKFSDEALQAKTKEFKVYLNDKKLRSITFCHKLMQQLERLLSEF